MSAAMRDGASNGAALDIAGLRLVPVGTELAGYLGSGSQRGLLVIGIDKSVRVKQHRTSHAIGRNPRFWITIALRQDLGAVQVDYVAHLRLVGF